MQNADRKLAWSAVFVLAVIAVELAWLIFSGPANRGGNTSAEHIANNGPWEWLFSSAFWTAFFTGALTISSYFLWQATRRSVRISERALTDLERPYIFAYNLSRVHADKGGWSSLTYSVGNYGKSAAVIERVRCQMWNGDPLTMPDLVGSPIEDEDHPALVTGVFSPDFALDNIEYLTGENVVFYSSPPILIMFPDPTNAIDLFFKIIIDYRGPFTAGHQSSYCWRWNEDAGMFVLMLDPKLTYNT